MLARSLLALGTAGAALALGPAAGTAGAQACTPKFLFAASAYDVQLCGMPDFDQRRVAARLAGDGRTIVVGPPLAGDGDCHCVPTSMTNLLGYYVDKGVEPGPLLKRFDWDARPGAVARPGVPAGSYLAGQAITPAEVAAYNATTQAIRLLGTDVTQSPCGTTFASVLDYAGSLRSLLPGVDFVPYVKKVNASTPRDMAQAMAAGATIAVAYGRYPSQALDASGASGTLGPRSGGHVVSVRGIKGSGDQAVWSTSDPARTVDPAEQTTAGQDLFRQGRFGASDFATRRVWAADQERHLWRIGDGSAYFDKWMPIYPTSAVLASGGTIEHVPGIGFNLQGTPRRVQVPGLRPRRLTVGGVVQDAVLLPTTGEVAYVRKGDASVRAVTLATGAQRVLGPAPADVTEIAADPTGTWVLAGGRSEVVQLGPGATLAEPDAARTVTRLPVPKQVAGLAFDGSGGIGNGRFAVIGSDAKLTLVRPGPLTAVAAPRTLPRSVLAGTGRVSAVVDRSGRLLLRRGAATTVAAAPVRGGTARLRTLGRLSGAGGLGLTERGALLTVVDGKLLELKPDGSPVSSSAFSGRAVRGVRVLDVNRAGSDLAPADAKVVVDERVVDPAFPEMAP